MNQMKFNSEKIEFNSEKIEFNSEKIEFNSEKIEFNSKKIEFNSSGQDLSHLTRQIPPTAQKPPKTQLHYSAGSSTAWAANQAADCGSPRSSCAPPADPSAAAAGAPPPTFASPCSALWSRWPRPHQPRRPRTPQTTAALCHNSRWPEIGNCYSNKNSITKYIINYFKLCNWNYQLK